jgi:hypothetical protein
MLLLHVNSGTHCLAYALELVLNMILLLLLLLCVTANTLVQQLQAAVSAARHRLSLSSYTDAARRRHTS